MVGTSKKHAELLGELLVQFMVTFLAHKNKHQDDCKVFCILQIEDLLCQTLETTRDAET